MFFRGFSGRGGLSIAPPPTDWIPGCVSEEEGLESDLAEGEPLTATVGILVVETIASSSEELPHPAEGTLILTSPSPASSLGEFLEGWSSAPPVCCKDFVREA